MPETRFLESDELAVLFARLPASGRHALRDRALLVFFDNTGARVQEVADLRLEHLDPDRGPRVRLRGKGDKWRTWPLWEETVRLLRALLIGRARDAPVFSSGSGAPLTRFGIYKIVRHHAATVECARAGHRISPHVFRHYAEGLIMPSGLLGFAGSSRDRAGRALADSA